MILEMHALIDPAEANVPPIDAGDPWDTELALLQQDTQLDPTAPLREAIEEVLEVATILA